jgi:hypothetical protein
MAPASGAIFRAPQAGRDANVCDKSAKPAISSKNHLPTGISHTKMPPWRTHQKARAHSGACIGAANAIWRGTIGAPHAFLLHLPLPDSQLAERSGCRTGKSTLQSVIVAQKEPLRS